MRKICENKVSYMVFHIIQHFIYCYIVYYTNYDIIYYGYYDILTGDCVEKREP